MNHNSNSNHLFYEITYSIVSTELTFNPRRNSPTGKIRKKVPFHRMNQTIQQIKRFKGKILSIKPLNGHEALSQPIVQKQDTTLPWWVKVLSTHPYCVYYFGPFNNQQEAEANQAGYIQDLEGEGNQGITVEILQAEPTILTQEK